jgi:phosphohistidine phosphatase SixA
MKGAIFVRHGNYDSHGGLSERGRAQIEGACSRLSPHVLALGPSVALLTSSAPRARESAEIVARHLRAFLDVTPESHEELWSDSEHRCNLTTASELVRQRGETADLVIVVTHLEYVEYLPRFLGPDDIRHRWYPPRPNYGEGYVIDCRKQTWQPL